MERTNRRKSRTGATGEGETLILEFFALWGKGRPSGQTQIGRCRSEVSAGSSGEVAVSRYRKTGSKQPDYRVGFLPRWGEAIFCKPANSAGQLKVSPVAATLRLARHNLELLKESPVHAFAAGPPVKAMQVLRELHAVARSLGRCGGDPSGKSVLVGGVRKHCEIVSLEPRRYMKSQGVCES
ncbi:hypothetical protein VTK26DRAFT_9509 [Humicola hyalothermophila]